MSTNKNCLGCTVKFKLSFCGFIQIFFPIVISFVITFSFDFNDSFFCIFNGNPFIFDMIVEIFIFIIVYFKFLLDENLFPIFLHLFDVVKFKQMRKYFQLIFIELLFVRSNFFLFLSL